MRGPCLWGAPDRAHLYRSTIGGLSRCRSDLTLSDDAMPGDLLGGGDSGEEASTCFFASLYLRRASTERAGDFEPLASAAMSAFASGDLDVVAFMLLPQPLNCFVRLVMDESRRRASISALVLLPAPVATGDGRMGGDGAPLGVTWSRGFLVTVETYPASVGGMCSADTLGCIGRARGTH
jgi:hypothetical protein